MKWLIVLCGSLSVFLYMVSVQGQITLTFWKFAATVDDPIIAKYVDLWNTLNPNVKVEFITMPWGDYTGLALPAAFAAGKGPDIFWLSPGDILRYVNEGLLLPFDGYVSEAELADLIPAARQRPTVEGVLYGLPIEIEPVAIYYNVDLFEEHGVEIPKDWDELLQVAKKLTTPERYGLIIETSPSYYQLFTWYPFLWSADADVMSPDWKEATMDSEGAIAALKLWGDLIKEGISPSTTPTPTNDILSNFASGLGAMQVCGMWAVAALAAQPPDFKVGVFPIPPRQTGTPRATVFGGWNFVVNKQTRYPREAVEFCKWFIFNTDFLKEFCVDRTAKLPSRISVTEAGKTVYAKDPLALYFVEEILPTARPEPRYPPEVAKPLMDALTGVMFGGLSAEEAAKIADAQIQAFLNTYTGRIGAY
ncbi:MAG: sugar ABC transporter substrate-binding protein [Candidatus Hadarchaeum sp.]|uniref:ABC transporter substrate-binding protein n=1 Tax=Candidatus Hadarchaeum sp. TaxID=2883567 RepID=UPI0031797F39